MMLFQIIIKKSVRTHFSKNEFPSWNFLKQFLRSLPVIIDCRSPYNDLLIAMNKKMNNEYIIKKGIMYSAHPKSSIVLIISN